MSRENISVKLVGVVVPAGPGVTPSSVLLSVISVTQHLRGWLLVVVVVVVGYSLCPAPVLASHTCLPGSDKNLLNTTRSQTDIEVFMVSTGGWWLVGRQHPGVVLAVEGGGRREDWF